MTTPVDVLVITVTPPNGPATVLDPIGVPGTPGKIFITGDNVLHGAGAPLDTLGADEQVYLNDTNSDVYQKSAGHWVLQVNLKGPAGPQGNAGLKGDDGIQGEQGEKGDTGDTGDVGGQGPQGGEVIFSNSNPGSGVGNNGDTCLVTSSWDVYGKSGGAWELKGNIKGAAGTNGTDGTDGADGAAILFGSAPPDAGLGKNGDAYFAASNGWVYSKSAGEWFAQFDSTGPAGPAGDTGAKGDTGDAGAKGDKGDPGDTGDEGAQGTRGSIITFGTSAPTTGHEMEGDTFIDTGNAFTVYEFTAGNWAGLGQLKGAQGDQGPQGDTGTAGAKGDKGDTGDAGTAGAKGDKGDTGDAGTPAINAADLVIFLPGVRTAANEIAYRIKVGRAFTWPASLTGSVFDAGAAATASTTYTISQNGTAVGTLVYAIAGTVPTVTFASAVTFAIDDVLLITGPAVTDATLADISWFFLGSR